MTPIRVEATISASWGVSFCSKFGCSFIMSHPCFFVKKNPPVSADVCEVEEKKSSIFSPPPHKHRLKRHLSFLAQSLGRLIVVRSHIVFRSKEVCQFYSENGAPRSAMIGRVANHSQERRYYG